MFSGIKPQHTKECPGSKWNIHFHLASNYLEDRDGAGAGECRAISRLKAKRESMKGLI